LDQFIALDEASKEEIFQDYTNRISKILLCNELGSLLLDQNILNKSLIQNEPMFIAAEVFK